MKISEFRKLIREEIKKVLRENFVSPNMTIKDLLATGKRVARGDIADWIWTSIPTLKSYNWKPFNMAPKFEPLLKQLEQYQDENVMNFFGKKAFNRLEQLQSLLYATDGLYRTREEYQKAFDEIYSIVTKTLKSK